jgi:hypothetical protein
VAGHARCNEHSLDHLQTFDFLICCIAMNRKEMGCAGRQSPLHRALSRIIKI